FCDVTLEPLTILVGRNASGKSNFLDALAFLVDLVDMRVLEAVTDRGGWDAIHCRSDHSASIEIGLEALISSYESEWDAAYSFALTTGDHNQIRVQHESLILTQHGGGRRCGYRLTDGYLEWLGREHFEDDSEWTSKVDV